MNTASKHTTSTQTNTSSRTTSPQSPLAHDESPKASSTPSNVLTPKASTPSKKQISKDSTSASSLDSSSSITPLASNEAINHLSIHDLTSYVNTLHAEVKEASTSTALEHIRVKALGKRGIFTQAARTLQSLDDKKPYAIALASLRKEFETAFNHKKQELDELALAQALQEQRIDVSLFHARSYSRIGHPIRYTMDRIVEFFTRMNYELCEGPLVEDDFHNFTALNLPEHHPARDMQDTFYFRDNKLLRTHTSPVQIRTMLAKKPPIQMICLGETFRRDYDVTHTPMFHQVEGLVVNEYGLVTFAHLKYVLEQFLRYMFGDVRVRFRSSFFPFTEPSAEVDISCMFCKGKGCRICGHTGWLEVLGCGMVDNRVFDAVGYERVSGYAFGMGVERLCMLELGISDLRSFFETDLRILEQF